MSQNLTPIFLVDDAKDDHNLFNDAFSEVPLETRIHTFSNGIELIAHLEDENYNQPPLILIDNTMPMMCGEECIQKLRNIHERDTVPILVYSTTILESITGRLSEMGADMYLKMLLSFPQPKLLLEDCMTRLPDIKAKGKRSFEFTVMENR